MPTLAALFVGATLAALTVYVLTRVIGAQRSVLDRDEVSEFSLFVKNVLNADVTCGNVLRGHAFEPGGEIDLSLPLSYGGVDGPLKGDAKDQSGFSLPGGLVHVKRLSLRDKGAKPIKFSVPIPNAEGVVEMVSVDRYLSQIKLELSHANGDAYRARFIEVPVLVNARGEIAACNNQTQPRRRLLGAGASGSTPRPSRRPACPARRASSAAASPTRCATGRTPVARRRIRSPTRAPAPEGFTDSGLGITGLTGGCGKFGCVYDYNEVHQCYRCP